MNREDLVNVLKELVELHRLQKISDEEFRETEQLLLSQLNLSSSLVAQQNLPSDNPHPFYPQPPQTQHPAMPPTNFKSHFPTSSLEKQTLMGRYYLESLIGQGGMGQVFLCYDMVREKYYALKLIHPHLAQFEELRSRFLQELKANELLTHSGIVRTYALEHDPLTDFLFFTMEYVEGITLETVLKYAEKEKRIPPLPPILTLRLLGELSDVLEYAHSQGVIHRDIKPSNIMLTKQGHLKLMDFGIAKLLEGDAASKHTGFGGFVYYMAPEQLKGGAKVTPAVDVFSLGVLTYQLLTGEIPMGAVIPPSHIWNTLNENVDHIILKAMNPKPQRRFASPTHFLQTLQKELLPLISSHEEFSLSQLVSQLLVPPTHIDPLFPNSYNNQPHSPTSTHNSPSSHNSALQYFPPKTYPPRREHSHPSLENYSSPRSPSPSLPSRRVNRHQKKTLSFSKDSSLQAALIQQTIPPQNEQAAPTSDELPAFEKNFTSSSPTTEQNVFQMPSSTPTTTPSFPKRSDIFDSEEVISLEQRPKPSFSKKQHLSQTPNELLQDHDDDENKLTSTYNQSIATPVVEELELEEEEEASPTQQHQNYQRTALELPHLNGSLEEKIFYSHDKTPLFRLVRIPAGPFLMGSRTGDILAYNNELPQRKVTLSSYWISRTPLTNRIWMKFIEESNYHCNAPDYLQHWRRGRPAPDRLEHPVVFISIKDLEAFCQFYGLAIPTEAQWEKAARGTEGQIWPWGNQKPHPNLCNFFGSQRQDTTPVALYPQGASPYGLLDCSGNVWEWTSDHWSVNRLQQMKEKPKDPHCHDPNSDEYAIRGGCFQYHGRGVRCAFRFKANKRSATIGARVVLLEAQED